MVYFDTSVLVALLAAEKTALSIKHWLDDLDPSMPLVVSNWIYPEFASALGIKLRLGYMTKGKLQKLCTELVEWLALDFAILSVTESDFKNSAALISHTGLNLRAGDALHLTVAQRCHAMHFATLDKDQKKAAAQLKLLTIDFQK